jgi:hypothetical protein
MLAARRPAVRNSLVKKMQENNIKVLNKKGTHGRQ